MPAVPDPPDNPTAAAAPNGATPAGQRSITTEDVVHVARLARLDLTDVEVETFTGQLQAVLDHAADMATLDLGGVQPMSHPLPVTNVLRPDVPSLSIDHD